MKTTQRSTKKWNHRNTVARRKRLREVHDLLRELPNLTAKQEARLELLMAERRGEVVINVRKKKFLYRIDQDAMRFKMPPFRIQREPPMSDHMLSTAYSLMYAFPPRMPSFASISISLTQQKAPPIKRGNPRYRRLLD